MKYHKASALPLALALLFSLAACKPAADAPTDEPTQEATATVPPTEEPSDEPVETPNLANGEEPDISLAVLSGPTGVGAAKLLDLADYGPLPDWYDYTPLRASYDYTIYTDNSELVAGLNKGEIDIATMASNVAVNLYTKTDGDVKIIAGGTLGVLHI